MNRQAILALSLVCCAGHAHDISVDGDASDWTLPGPTLSNVGHVVRGADSSGELVWRDGPGDTITALNNPERETDIVEMRITATESALLIMLRFDDLAIAGGPGAVQTQLALDLDQIDASGQTGFDGGADLAVADDAAWEYLLVTAFGSGSNQLVVVDDTLARSIDGSAALDVGNDVIELSVPWQALGLTGPASSAVRITVATFRSDAADTVTEVGDSSQANALDVVTNNQQPGINQSSSSELADQVANFHLDVWFHPDGEVRSPLLITAAQSRPAGLIGGEFIEIINTGDQALDLAGFGIGDEETPGATEGMFAFPGYSLAPQQRITVARSAFAYNATNGRQPDFETEMSDPGVVTLSQDTRWAIGGLDLVDSGDQILLLDTQSTVIDAIAYGSAFYIGTESLVAGGGGDTHYRAPRLRDRNLADDFRFRIADLAVTIVQAPERVLEGSSVQYLLEISNLGPDSLAEATLRLQQFVGLQLVSSSCQNVSPGSTCAPLDAETLEAALALEAGESLRMLIDADVQTAAGGDVQLDVTVQPEDEVGELVPADNFATDQQPVLGNMLFSDSYESLP